jgi:predicted transcriptional regulator
LDVISLLAFSISIVSVVIVMVSVMLHRREVTNQYHSNDDTGLEVSAIVSEFSQRMRRLEENLVDQKVKSEILELRMRRSSESVTSSTGRMPNAYERPELHGENEVNVTPKSLSRSEQVQVRASSADKKIEIDRRSGSTELEALRLVFEGRGNATAKDIQQRIGRTREHTARMMNSLFQEGLVERNVTARPFVYSITQKGRDLLNS